MTENTETTRTTLAWGRGHVRHGRVPEWLLDSDASDRAIRLYALLATYADRDGKAFPGKRLLLRRLRCSEPSYRRSAAELEALGALTRTPRSREDGSQTSNDYALHWLPIASQEIGEGVAGDAPPSSPETGLSRARSSTPDLEIQGDLEETSSPASQATEAGPPKLTKIDGRDVAFDALAEVCGVDPGGNRAREVGIALNGSKRSGLALGIRALAWRDAQRDYDDYDEVREGEGWERLLCGYISVRAERYLRAMPGAALTPLALAKWWTDLDRPASDPATRAAAEAVRLAEEGR